MRWVRGVQSLQSPGSGWAEHPFTTISHGQGGSGENMQQAAKSAELPGRAVKKITNEKHYPSTRIFN